jgi:hypothetical protein
VFEPGLEVPGAGFDDSARSEAVRREPRKRGLVEIVKRGEAVLSRWPDVDMRAVGIAVVPLSGAPYCRRPTLGLGNHIMMPHSRWIEGFSGEDPEDRLRSSRVK